MRSDGAESRPRRLYKVCNTQVSDIVVEPYNAVMGLKHLVEDTELTFCLDNEVQFTVRMQYTKNEPLLCSNFVWKSSLNCPFFP